MQTLAARVEIAQQQLEEVQHGLRIELSCQLNLMPLFVVLIHTQAQLLPNKEARLHWLQYLVNPMS